MLLWIGNGDLVFLSVSSQVKDNCTDIYTSSPSHPQAITPDVPYSLACVTIQPASF